MPAEPAASSLAVHEWNFKAAAAVVATAGRMEVLVRRAVGQQLAELGRARGSENWPSSLPLDAHELRTIRWAQRHVGGYRDVTESTMLVVEHVPLGFWLHLVSRRYHTRLWIPGLAKAFPQIPGSASTRREAIHLALSRAVHFRNLAAHLHPLHDFNADAVLQPFSAVAAAIHPEAAVWLTESSCIARVWSSRPTQQAEGIPRQSDVSATVAESGG